MELRRCGWMFKVTAIILATWQTVMLEICEASVQCLPHSIDVDFLAGNAL